MIKRSQKGKVDQWSITGGGQTRTDESLLGGELYSSTIFYIFTGCFRIIVRLVANVILCAIKYFRYPVSYISTNVYLAFALGKVYKKSKFPLP